MDQREKVQQEPTSIVHMGAFVAHTWHNMQYVLKLLHNTVLHVYTHSVSYVFLIFNRCFPTRVANSMRLRYMSVWGIYVNA